MDVVITHGVRTPIGKIGKSLKDFDIAQLGKQIVTELIENRAKIARSEIDAVILGNVKQSANPANLARYVALSAQLANVPAHTVHRQCGSGLQAIMDAYAKILAGQAEVVIAGGVENMSQSTYFMRNTKDGLGSGNYTIEDSLTQGGPSSVPFAQFGDLPMGITAENVANKYGITREEQDIFAMRSQEKAKAAIEKGYFRDQIMPIGAFDTDEHPFMTTLEKLSALKPVFKKDGSVTAGNSSGRNDGAAALLIMSGEKAKQLGYEPLVKITASASSGLDPALMGLGPVDCTAKGLKQAGWKIDDLDVIELNEAFAAQSIGVVKEYLNMGADPIKLERALNPNGGAIALGHPLGCTGALLTIKCMYELHRTEEKKKGLISLCCAGGLGVALFIERVGRCQYAK